MRLLIITQKVDKEDPILGFFHRWIEEFAKHYSEIIVVCLEKGSFDLPKNVRVLSLGKEQRQTRIQYIWRFYKHVWNERNNYDSVFVHMNPEYVVLGGLFWKLFRKRIGLWYVHRQVDLKLRIAEKIANVIFTSTPESFNIASEKVNFIGHGIDTEKFSKKYQGYQSHTLLHVGRIAPIKHCEVLIEALGILKGQQEEQWAVEFVGSPVYEKDFNYSQNIKEQINKAGLEEKVEFVGSLNQEDLSNKFSQVYASVNLTPTGGMDKAVLESLASGCPVFTSNNAFEELFGEYASMFIFDFADPQALSDKIKLFQDHPQKAEIIEYLSCYVRQNFGVKNIISKISNELST